MRMENEKHIILFAKEKFPTRELLRLSMKRRFGTENSIMDSVIDVCAEEAESVFLRYWSYQTNHYVHQEENRPMDMRVGSSGSYAKHPCPNCRHRAIKFGFNFCSNCGIGLNWIGGKKHNH